MKFRKDNGQCFASAKEKKKMKTEEDNEKSKDKIENSARRSSSNIQLFFSSILLMCFY